MRAAEDGTLEQALTKQTEETGPLGRGASDVGGTVECTAHGQHGQVRCQDIDGILQQDYVSRVVFGSRVPRRCPDPQRGLVACQLNFVPFSSGPGPGQRTCGPVEAHVEGRMFCAGLQVKNQESRGSLLEMFVGWLILFDPCQAVESERSFHRTAAVSYGAAHPLSPPPRLGGEAACRGAQCL